MVSPDLMLYAILWREQRSSVAPYWLVYILSSEATSSISTLTYIFLIHLFSHSLFLHISQEISFFLRMVSKQNSSLSFYSQAGSSSLTLQAYLFHHLAGWDPGGGYIFLRGRQDQDYQSIANHYRM